MTIKDNVKLERGMVAIIYQDPITCLKPEGPATLISPHIEDLQNPLWNVKFHGESGSYLRSINLEHCFDYKRMEDLSNGA